MRRIVWLAVAGLVACGDASRVGDSPTSPLTQRSMSRGQPGQGSGSSSSSNSNSSSNIVQGSGLTWGKVSHDAALGIDRVHCWGAPAVPAEAGGPGCNPYQGDTSCDTALPVLCLKRDGSPRPPYAITCQAHAMSAEFYCGWAGGEIRLTPPIVGAQLESQAETDALCASYFGVGFGMAEHHDGLYVTGMDEDTFFGDTWPSLDELSSGGWGFFALGDIDPSQRFWVAINDQLGNCWDHRASP